MAVTKTTRKNAPIQWDMSKVVVYRRVSTDAQEKSGLGLEAQKEMCDRTCAQLGLSIVADFAESVSGKVDPRERVELMKAIELCQTEGARLMIAKLDRFSREVYHVTGYCDRYFFGDRTPELIVAESPNASMLELRIKAVLAQEERELIAKRTREALSARKARGAAPNGEVGRNAARQKAAIATDGAIQYAMSLRELGHGYHAIAKTLNDEGFATSRGGKWYAANVRQRLQSV